jgi:hypothetical protein
VWRLGRAPRLSMAERERGGGGCGNAEVRVGEAVVGERGGARGVGEQRDGVEEERVGGGGKGKCSRRRHSRTGNAYGEARRRQNILQAESDRTRCVNYTI